MSRRALGLLIAVVAAVGGAAGLPLLAEAHALLQSSVPTAGDELASPPARVILTFGEAPDPKLSTVTVVDTSGACWDSGPTLPVPGHPDQLEVALRHLPNGVYTVSWRTISAVDGHLAAGSFAFGVGVTPSGSAVATVATSPGPSALAVAGRWCFYAGTLLLLGLGLGAVRLFADPRLLPGWLGPAGIGLALVGIALLVGDATATTGLGPGDLLGSSVGHAILWRAAPLAAGTVVLAVGGRGTERRRWAAGSLAALATLALAADVAASHAGAQSPVALNLGAQFLHVLAVGLWVGGLVALLLGLRGAPSEVTAVAARRFSQVALVGLGVVAATGLLRAAIEIGAWDRVLGTAFGRLVVVKSGLLVALAALGAVNRFRHVPAAGRTLGGLRRVGSTELALAAAAVLATSALVNIAPPATATAASPTPPPVVTATGADTATTVRARLQVSPGTPGFNTFTLELRDYDTGQPIAADTVRLVFDLPEVPTLGSSTLTLRRIAPGVYSARGPNLSLDGTWRIEVFVDRGAQSTEVVLTLATRSVAPKVDISRFSGEPTLYTVHLAAGRSVQLYLDPGRAGANELHVTFFDATGEELPISDVRLSATGPGGTAMLAPRRLGGGHFVADVELRPPSTHVVVLATTADGIPLRVVLDMEVAR